MVKFVISSINVCESLPSSFQGDSVEMFTQDSHESRVQQLFEKNIPAYLIGITEMTGVEGETLYSIYDGPSIHSFHDMSPLLPDPEKQVEIKNIHYFALDTFDLGSKKDGVVEKRPSKSKKFIHISGDELRILPAISVAQDYGNPYISKDDQAQAAFVVANDCYERSIAAAPDKSRSLPLMGKAMKWAWSSGEHGLPQGRQLCENISNAFWRQQVSNAAKKQDKEELLEDIKQFLKENPGVGINEIQHETESSKREIISVLQKMEHNGEIIPARGPKGKVFSLVEIMPVEEAILSLSPENEVEERIIDAPSWREGVEYGKPRQGHPEGKVIYHIQEIFQNIEEKYVSSPFRSKLRLLAMVHDSFKHQVSKDVPKRGANHHGAYARKFTESFTDDEGLLEITRRHDDAYNIWRKGKNSGDWEASENEVRQLILDLGDNVALYHAFFECDCKTGNKTHAPFEWFSEIIRSSEM
ncbi:MAG: hypothetical protein ACI9S8_001115 [Chlamydiales bacterium]|jgi:hypothetical protein